MLRNWSKECDTLHCAVYWILAIFFLLFFSFFPSFLFYFYLFFISLSAAFNVFVCTPALCTANSLGVWAISTLAPSTLYPLVCVGGGRSKRVRARAQNECQIWIKSKPHKFKCLRTSELLELIQSWSNPKCRIGSNLSLFSYGIEFIRRRGKFSCRIS